MNRSRDLYQTTRWSFWAFMVVVVCFIYQEFVGVVKDKDLEENLQLWLRKNSLSFAKGILKRDGITSFDKILQLDADNFVEKNNLNFKQRNIFIEKLAGLRIRSLKLTKWLDSKGLKRYSSGFYKLGYIELDSVQEKMQRLEIKNVVNSMDGSFSDYQLLVKAVLELKNASNSWMIVSVFSLFYNTIMFFLKWLLRLLFLVFGCVFLHLSLRHYNSERRGSFTFFQYFIGYCLDPMRCQVEWLQKDNVAVGSTASFLVKLYRGNWLFFYTITGRENLKVEIRNPEGTEQFIKEQEGGRKNAYRVIFHPKLSGRYTISVLVNGKHIHGSPFVRTFMSGPIDMSKMSILNGISTIVVKKGIYYPLKFETRDKYENSCEMECSEDMFEVHVKQVGSNGTAVDSEPVVLPESNGGKNMLHIKLEEEGCFHAVVTCQGRSITNGVFDVVSLNHSEMERLEKATVTDSWHQTWYEGYLLPSSYSLGPQDDWTAFLKASCRKIYLYFSSRQISIKEFYLKIIPYRLHSFRISPSTKVIFPDSEGHEVFVLDDGIQPPVTFMSSKRSLVVATFARFLLRNIGGAESFQDKRRFFFKALQAHHGKNKLMPSRNVDLEINRSNVLESSYEATKNFSVSKWCRHFKTTFQGEPGVDAGGLTREWISILSTALFDPKNEFFTQFDKEDKQALIYPNPTRPSRLKLKYYEFAGRVVGKCIFESSCSSSRTLNVRARFMRSFLAQLIGLRVNYKYFKTDDKQLYSSKIKYIQETDPEDLNLYFCEEEYDNDGKLLKEVDLIPDGSKIEVTKENKMKYLDALAQYKLHTRVSKEIEAFTKGLNELVPDNLLTMFSEQELELLICGTSDISVNDLKNNHNIFNSHSSFPKVMSWFWTSVALFNQEEFARLLQFTTGSSQLPPGGFSCLTPQFSFSSSPLKNALPRAHTCFNQLVLPDYTSYEEFNRCLHLAITEGCEGFGFE